MPPASGTVFTAYPDLSALDADKGRRVRVTVDGDAPGAGTGLLLRIRDDLLGSILTDREPVAGAGIESHGSYFVVQGAGRLAANWPTGGLSAWVASRAASMVDEVTGTGSTVAAKTEDLDAGVAKTVHAPEEYRGNDGWLGNAAAEGLSNVFRPVGAAVGNIASSVAGGFWGSLSWGAILLGLFIIAGIVFYYFGR